MGNYVQRVGDLIFTLSVFATIVIFVGYQQEPYFGSYLISALSSLVMGLMIAVFGRMSAELTSIRVTSEEQTKILRKMMGDRSEAQPPAA